MSNVNSFSAIIDRLIIENLKIIHFIDKDDLTSANSQNEVISELKFELDKIYNELYNNAYTSVEEKRTYDSDKLFNDIFLLCLNNYSIMVGDSLKIEESKKEVINIEKLRWYIQLVRGNLEHRSKIKNNLEQL
jgi:hypothetical protein